MMALLFIPAFCQEERTGINAISEIKQGLTSEDTALIATQIRDRIETGLQNLTASQIKNQIQTMIQDRNHSILMLQNMSVEVSNGSINISAHGNNEQRIAINANSLRLNNEDLFNDSSAMMAQINAAIRNHGIERNLSIMTKNGELVISEDQVRVRIRNSELIIQNDSLYLNISNNAVELKITPTQAMVAARIHNSSVADAEIVIENEIPKYHVKEQKSVKILGLFSAKMSVDSKLTL